MKLKVAFIFAVGWGCSSAKAVSPSSATLETTTTHDWVLSVDTSWNALARLKVAINLGPTPTPSELSSDTLTTWEVEGLSATSSCTFIAGNASVPTGSFALSLDSIDTTTGTVHGTLHVVAYVHPPPSTDCGHGDIENIDLVF